MSARTLARRALCLCSRIMWLQPQRQAPCPSLPSVLTSGLTPYLQHSWGVSSMSISITAFTPGFRLGPTEIGLWLRPVQESRRQGCGEGAGVLGAGLEPAAVRVLVQLGSSVPWLGAGPLGWPASAPLPGAWLIVGHSLLGRPGPSLHTPPGGQICWSQGLS